MRYLITTLILCVWAVASASGQLIFPDSSVQTTAAGAAQLRNVIVVDSVGEAPADTIQNGANLLAAMNGIPPNNTVETIILLGSGVYDVQTSTIEMKQNVGLHGSGSNPTVIVGSGTVVLRSTPSRAV